MFQIIKRIFAIAGEEKKCLSWGIFFNLLENMMVFVPYTLLFYCLNQYLSDSLTQDTIKVVAVGMVVSIILRCIFRRLVDGLQSAKGLNIFARQRQKFVEHLKRLPMGYYSEDNMGNIVSVLTTDLIFIEENVMTCAGQLISSYIAMGLSFIFLLFYNTILGMVYGTLVCVAFVFINHLDKVNKKHGKIRQEQFGVLSNSIVQFIKGLATVKAFGMNDEENVDLEEVFVRTKENSLEFEHKYFLPRITTDLSHTMGISAMIIATVMVYFEGKLSLDNALGMLIFSSVCFHGLISIINAVPRLDLLEVGLDRFEEIMSVEELHDGKQNVQIKNWDIKFEDVHFAYDNKEVIQGVNFDIKENTFAALVGPSGSGKTTVTRLIARFWDIKEGSIKIGGKDIRKFTCDSLLNHMSIVFQNVYLFNDTIEANIRYGKPNASKEEIIEAAKKACCHDFIMALPEGYATRVGEGGSHLSGGEKQRISIARAILKDAPIILLDEATSSIDPDNEVYIQNAINELVQDKTLIVIAHRLKTIQNANQILVMKEGRLVEKGTHEQLLAQEGEYYNLSQHLSCQM